MWWRVYASVVLLMTVGRGCVQGAQVTIENPKNLPVNEERVNLLYTMICQEMAKTYHIRDYKKLEYPLTLVLGEEYERYSIEVSTGSIYLQKWDETRFASGATLLAFHRVLSEEQFRIVAMKALKRFRNTRPVTVSEARTLR